LESAHWRLFILVPWSARNGRRYEEFGG